MSKVNDLHYAGCGTCVPGAGMGEVEVRTLLLLCHIKPTPTTRMPTATMLDMGCGWDAF